MHSQIKLGRIFGIEIGLHYSWFVIAILIAFSLATHFHQVRPDWRQQAVWSAAIITAILFFAALLLHELAHSIVAKSRGLNVHAITLFALGGVSQIESEPPDAKSEFWIAIVGPLTSLVIGIVFLAITRLWEGGGAAEAPTVVGAVLLWLGYINIALAAFNMIPGYPLDGGRILRSILWWISGSAQRATRWASQVGQLVGFLFILFGLYRFFVGANFGGLWLAFIGWFLLDAARSSYLQTGLVADLRDRKVADLMERNCLTVPGYLSLRDFVDEYLLHSAGRCFLVAQDGNVVGIVTPNETRAVPREEWPQTSVQSVMRPFNKMLAVAPDMPAVKALEMMSRENVNQLPVIADGKLEGIFSRRQLFRFFQVYAGRGRDRHDHAASFSSSSKRGAAFGCVVYDAEQNGLARAEGFETCRLVFRVHPSARKQISCGPLWARSSRAFAVWPTAFCGGAGGFRFLFRGTADSTEPGSGSAQIFYELLVEALNCLQVVPPSDRAMLNNAQREHPTQTSNSVQFVQIRVVQIDTACVSEHSSFSH